MGGPIQPLMAEFKKKMNDDLTQSSIYHVFALLDAAFVKTGGTDPVKVAAALEGMKLKSFNGEVEMRKTDHQLQQGLDRKSTRLNSSHSQISYAVFCLKK